MRLRVKLETTISMHQDSQNGVKRQRRNHMALRIRPLPTVFHSHTVIFFFICEQWIISKVHSCHFVPFQKSNETPLIGKLFVGRRKFKYDFEHFSSNFAMKKYHMKKLTHFLPNVWFPIPNFVKKIAVKLNFKMCGFENFG